MTTFIRPLKRRWRHCAAMYLWLARAGPPVFPLPFSLDTQTLDNSFLAAITIRSRT
jgi:hypothetical protein